MNKIIPASVLVLALLISFASAGFSETVKAGWEHTVTLSGGNVILDMSGEWDMHSEAYGQFIVRPLITDVLTIKQEGAKFTAIKQIGSTWVPKGAETIKGELDKSGFKTVYLYLHQDIWSGEFAWEPCKWEIVENGNKVMIDCGERVKVTLTRK